MKCNVMQNVFYNVFVYKKNVTFSIHMYIKKKRTERFANKKMQQFIVQQEKKLFLQ